VRIFLQPYHTAVPKSFSCGWVFGVTIPKAYPVAAARFTALLTGHTQNLGWGEPPGLVGTSCFGSIFAHCLWVILVGLASFRTRGAFPHRRRVTQNRAANWNALFCS
jgi:hypothetical protein